jgi:pyruvate/2-oxoglutarate dehydrogenase complex dihydrolipoamide dehydrogenase (E3) component
MGGDCLNTGCVPSKALIASARVAADARSAAPFGVRVSGVDVDFPAVMERVRRIRSQISFHDAAEKFRKMGVDIFMGQGKFIAPDAVEVDGQTLRFARACIATGARAVHPDVPGLAETGFLTNESVFSLTERPRRLAVFGSGPLGCELAQAFARLGSEVTIIERGPQFLPKEDRDAAEILGKAFQREGIQCLLNSAIKRVARSGDEKHVHYGTASQEQVLVVDEILVGYGRAPNVDGMGLDTAGVKFDTRNGVEVDDHLRTTNPHIYAAGDVCLTAKFTHTAEATAKIVIRNALFWGRQKLSALTIPWCTYTAPEIAHVGLYAQEAMERGIEVVTYTKELSDNDRAIAEGAEDGFIRVHVRKGTDKIVGATIVARDAGDMISEITLAMVGGLGLGSISGTIHPYPTVAEAIKGAGDLAFRSRLTPFLKKLFVRILAWRR